MRVSRGRRRGVSEIVATVLTVAITVVAGAAVFGYVNAQAGVAEGQLGQSVGAVNAYLNEQYGVGNINFSNSALSVWFYNYGGVSLQPVQVQLYNSSRSLFVQFNATKVVNLDNPGGCSVAASSYESPILYNSLTGATNPSGVVDIAKGAVASITFTLPRCLSASLSSGRTYYVTVTGLYGNRVTYFEMR